MDEAKNVEDERKTHLDMWRHYDTLRQAKNSVFITANSILVAITGILFKEAQAVKLIVLVSLLGIVVCISWFLLLARNAAYIEFHRKLAGQEWRPRRTPRSKYLDRTPLSAFFLFWVAILVLRFWRIP